MEGRVSNNEAVGAELTRDDPQADAKGLANDSRFYCPYPGCNRSFAELWRLKVHYRAPPDIRGSGKERGHGTELTHCPKCNKTLKPGKHHVGCSGGKTAPRQAIKRSRMGSDTGSGFDEDLADGPTSNQVRPRKSEGAGDGGPADVHGTAPFGHDFSAGAYAAGPPLYDQDGQPRQDWAQVHAPPPAMFYPPQPGMAYWPDPNNPMNGYMPHPGMAPYPAQFMGPPQPYPGHPGMPQPYPGYPMMPGQVPPPNYMPTSGVAQNTVVMQQPVAPGVQQNSMPGLSPLQQSQQHQQQQQQQQQPSPQQAHQAPQHQQGPQPPPMPQQQHAGSHLQSQGQGQQQSAPHQPAQPAQPAHQQPHERSTAAASASGQSDALGSDGMFDIEEFAKDFGRIPSPPPLPPDFHAATGGTSMLFNFAQFSQRLQRTQSFTALDRELAAAGLELPDPSLLYDHTDDGDIMQLLFGVPDDVPTMATIHIHAHKWNEDDDTGSVGPSLAMSQQQPQPSSTGRPAASQLGQQHSSQQQQQQQQQLQQQGHPSMVSSHPGVQPLQAPTHQVLVPEQLQEAHTTQRQQHQLLPPSGMDHHVQHGELTNGAGGDSLLTGSMASTGNRKILGAGRDLRGDDVLASHLAPPKAAESRAVVCSQDDHHHHSRDNLLDAETFQLLQSCD